MVQHELANPTFDSKRTMYRSGGLRGIVLCAALIVAVGCSGSNSQEAAAETNPPSSSTESSTPIASTTVSTSTTSSTTTTTTSPPMGIPTYSVPPVVPVDGKAALIRKVDTTDRVVFLTIDDGIVKDQKAMDFIVENRWPVTLFLVSGELNENPEFFARVLEVGGTISSHTLSHPTLKGMSVDAQEREICGMVDVIRDRVGVAGHFVRPPYGSHDENTRRAAAACGLNAVVLWNSSLWEGNIDIMHRPTLEPGDIFLTHFRSDLYDNLLTLNYHLYKDGFRLGRLQDYLPMS